MSIRPIKVALGALIKNMAPVEEDLEDDLLNDAKNVHMTSTYLFYFNRPDELEDICLADFSTFYSASYSWSPKHEFSIRFVQQRQQKIKYFTYV